MPTNEVAGLVGVVVVAGVEQFGYDMPVDLEALALVPGGRPDREEQNM